MAHFFTNYRFGFSKNSMSSRFRLIATIKQNLKSTSIAYPGAESNSSHAMACFSLIKMMVAVITALMIVVGCQTSSDSNSSSSGLESGDSITLDTYDGGTVNGTLVDQDGDNSMDGVDLDNDTDSLEFVFLQSDSTTSNRNVSTSTSASTTYAVDVTEDNEVDFYLRILDETTGRAELNTSENGSGTVLTITKDDDGNISGIDTDGDGEPDLTGTVVSYSSDKEIIAFSFTADSNSALSSDAAATISGTNITLTVPYGTDLTSLIADFTTTGETVTVSGTVQTSGTTENNFSDAVTYTVTAADNTTQDYTVSVSWAANTAKAITDFSFNATDNDGVSVDLEGVIDEENGTISVDLSYLVEDSSLIATFSTTGESVTVDGSTQISGISANDFSGAVIYTVTAADGESTDYIVTATQISMSHRAYLKAPNTSDEDQFGYRVALSGDTLAVGVYKEASSTTEIIHGSDLSTTNDDGVESGAVHVYRRTGSTWALEAYLKAPNTSTGDQFGYALDIEGDTIVVGARYEESNTTSIIHGSDLSDANDLGTLNGAAYVFTRSGSTWSLEAYLKAPNGNEEHLFGSSVAISGDTIVVGAPDEMSETTSIIHGSDLSATNNDGDQIGAAYVFTRTGSTWSHEAYLKAPNDAQGCFGTQVAISGDTIVASSPNENGDSSTIIHGSNLSAASMGGADNGAVYVFTRSGSTWSHEAYLKAPNNSDQDYFGSALAIDSDTVAVGSMGEDSAYSSIIHGSDLSDADSAGTSSNSGAVYIFTRSDSTWSHEAYLKAPNNSSSDYFSNRSLSLDEDRLLVRAASEDGSTSSIIYGSDVSDTNNDGNMNGAAYLFSRNGSTWSHTAYLKSPNNGNLDDFSVSVALDADTIAISASGEDSNSTDIIHGSDLSEANDDGSNNGAVYIFR